MRDAVETHRDRVLAWYDANARELPWRVAPELGKRGKRPDPYRVWLSEVMLQQTTVAAVQGYFEAFTRRWPSVEALAAASDADVMAAWAGLGYYARARNMLKCAREIATRHDGCFPEDRADLQALPGIGPYTSAAIAAIAFDRRETVVDGNVERVIARLFAVKTPLPRAKKELAGLADQLTPSMRAGDYAQAMMDLGATICTARKPDCDACPLHTTCVGNAEGLAQDLPHRTAKPPKPLRHGIAYVVLCADGALLLERRAENGLLGGMLGWPGSEWAEKPSDTPPCEADWQILPEPVRHTFTHFHLRLTVKTAFVPANTPAKIGSFVKRGQFNPGDLPTVMRKAYDLAAKHHKKV